jgi:LytS/YehU family sensor histidine kinase
MLVFLGLAYIFTKTSVFTALVNNSLTLPDKMIIYLVLPVFAYWEQSSVNLRINSKVRLPILAPLALF